MSTTKVVNHVSECYIKPKYEVEESKHPFYLKPLDLSMLSFHYIQKGLLFTKPLLLNDQEDFSALKFVQTLKQSLSLALVHFYPLAGQFVTHVDEEQRGSLVFVDCNKGCGIRFIHASVDMTVSDILSPTDVPVVVHSFFDHDRGVNHDGHRRPLLTQVTELNDRIFIGCSANHAVFDGTSYWRFWNIWSEIHRANSGVLSVLRLPVYDRWLGDGPAAPAITLPFTNPDEFITRFESPKLRERFFHFSSESIARLKNQANKEANTDKISSFQALSALCWRSIIRARRLLPDQETSCTIIASNRHRLNPPLQHEYFSNCTSALRTSPITVADLHEQSLGRVALIIHQLIRNHNHRAVEDHVNAWLASPYVYQPTMFKPSSVLMGSSPRFNMYGNEFGLGKPIAVRSGYANKFAGKGTSYPGVEGGGSVDLEIYLAPESMIALESDNEFMNAVSF